MNGFARMVSRGLLSLFICSIPDSWRLKRNILMKSKGPDPNSASTLELRLREEEAARAGHDEKRESFERVSSEVSKLEDGLRELRSKIADARDIQPLVRSPSASRYKMKRKCRCTGHTGECSTSNLPVAHVFLPSWSFPLGYLVVTKLQTDLSSGP